MSTFVARTQTTRPVLEIIPHVMSEDLAPNFFTSPPAVKPADKKENEKFLWRDGYYRAFSHDLSEEKVNQASCYATT